MEVVSRLTTAARGMMMQERKRDGRKGLEMIGVFIGS
jgi:hypothetical protein